MVEAIHQLKDKFSNKQDIKTVSVSDQNIDLVMKISSYFIFTVLICTQFLFDHSNGNKGFESIKVLVFQLVSIFAFIFFLIELYRQFEKKQMLNSLLKLIAPFILFSLITGVITVFFFQLDPSIWLVGSPFRYMGFFSILCLAVIFSYFYIVKNINFWFIISIYIVIGSIHGVIGLTEALNSSWDLLETGRYLNGNFGQTNFYSALLSSLGLVSLFVFVKLFASKSKSKKLLSILLLFIFLITSFVQVLTFSQGGIIAYFYLIFLTIANIPIYLKYRNRKLNTSITIVSIILFNIVAIGYFFSIKESRFLYWTDISRLIIERPFFGYGGFDTLLNTVTSRNLIDGRIVDRSHNIVLDFLYAYGVLGAVSLFYILKKVYNRLFSNLKFGHMVYLVPIIVFITTGMYHTKSIYHFIELVVFSALFLRSK